jgi:hypothetical protein
LPLRIWNSVASYTHVDEEIARGAPRPTVLALGERIVIVALDFNLNAWEELWAAAIARVPVHLFE